MTPPACTRLGPCQGIGFVWRISLSGAPPDQPNWVRFAHLPLVPRASGLVPAGGIGFVLHDWLRPQPCFQSVIEELASFCTIAPRRGLPTARAHSWAPGPNWLRFARIFTIEAQRACPRPERGARSQERKNSDLLGFLGSFVSFVLFVVSCFWLRPKAALRSPCLCGEIVAAAAAGGPTYLIDVSRDLYVVQKPKIPQEFPKQTGGGRL